MENLLLRMQDRLGQVKGLDKLLYGFIAGFFISGVSANYVFTPDHVLYADDNGDGTKDLIVKTNGGFEYLFYQDSDGNFRYFGMRQ